MNNLRGDVKIKINMKHSKPIFFTDSMLFRLCSYFWSVCLFQTKNKSFEEKLAPDLQLPSSDCNQKEDHYPPISHGIPLAEIQRYSLPRQIFSSEVLMRSN